MTRGSLAVLVLVLACSHGVPYGVPGQEAAGPPAGGEPGRITFATDSEWNPAWSADASRILYSFAADGRGDGDRCLGWLPGAGGQRAREFCWRNDGDADSTDTIVLAAESPAGLLAFVAERGVIGARAPQWRALLAGPADRPDRARVALTFPLPTPGGLVYFGARNLVWTADSVLVFEALFYAYSGGSASTPPDTITTGLELARLDLRGPAPVLTPYPSTRLASSASAGPSGTVLFTRGNDSLVYALDPATGVLSVFWDAGALGVVRDVQWTPGRLVVVAQGLHHYAYDPVLGVFRQEDFGGFPYVVDLTGGAPPMALSTRFYFRNLALAPSGRRLVAEAFVYDIAPRPPGGEDAPIDTTVALASDLFLFEVR